MKLSIQPGNVITFCVGLLFIAGAFYAYTSLGRYVESVDEVSATVVDVVYEAGTKKARNHPVVRFRTRDGREVTATAQQHQHVQSGDRVQIMYDPQQPEEIEIGTIERVKNRRVLITALAAAIGLLVCTLGIGLDANTLEWRFSRKRQTN